MPLTCGYSKISTMITEDHHDDHGLLATEIN